MTAAPDTFVLTSPQIEAITIGDTLVTPTGRTQTTLAHALASGGSGGNPALLYAVDYLPPGYTFGTLTGGVPTPLSVYYTLAEARAKYGSLIVSATTQYIDCVAVQAAVLTAQGLSSTQGYTAVVLPPGNQYWDRQVGLNASEACLIGSGNTGSLTTNVFTQTVGAGTAALRIYGGGLSGNTVLSGIVFGGFNSGWLAMPGNQGGVAAPGGVPSGMTVPVGFYYYTGAIALALDNANNGIVRNVAFVNYDGPMTYLTGNVYIWDFFNCVYTANNHGINIEADLTNSFERMRWSGGSTHNNNINISLTPGVTASGSLFIDNTSIDYPNVWHVVTDFGSSAQTDMKMSLTIRDCHIETDSAHSGTANARIFNGGILNLTNNFGDEEGSFPVGWVAPGFYARTNLTGNVIPGQGQGGTYMPAVYAAAPVQWAPTGSGNTQRYGGDIILFRSPDGDLMGGPPIQPAQAIGASYPLGYYSPLTLQLLNTGGTITIPADATIKLATGTQIKFITTDASTWVISPTSPATCAGTLTGIGGAIGTKFTLTKFDANKWTL